MRFDGFSVRHNLTYVMKDQSLREKIPKVELKAEQQAHFHQGNDSGRREDGTWDIEKVVKKRRARTASRSRHPDPGRSGGPGSRALTPRPARPIHQHGAAMASDTTARYVPFGETPTPRPQKKDVLAAAMPHALVDLDAGIEQDLAGMAAGMATGKAGNGPDGRTISGCIVRATAQVPTHRVWEVPCIRGSPLKSAGRSTGGGRERAFGSAAGMSHAQGAQHTNKRSHGRGAQLTQKALAHVLYEGVYGLWPVSSVAVWLLGGLTCYCYCYC